MHPSAEIFDRIQTLYVHDAGHAQHLFFCRAAGVWQNVTAVDLESFYRHVHGGQFQATAILTPYSVRQRSLLIAHYESPTEAAHRIWSVGLDGRLNPMYESPVQSRYSGSGSLAA